ncbi:MAG: hypothetical protein KGH61_01770 [Candidatus Micrarchaeota archaeon]|nr:hypothetical protein [Candidatus Micrarchaeota archaeon]MDE1847658.1 hypothetical protein [Candidatus Micrarchaeota archaeon]MDE1864479.1 hypothetical protein [Candidatus Micrarchaeota archaeon]
MFDPRQLISRLISDYYEHAQEIVPSRVEQREFGFGTFDAKVAVRHIAFNSGKALKEYLASNAPAYASCSQAFYKYPGARPMEKKEHLGAEIVFDIDATDMNLPCQRMHGKKWVCEECLKQVKAETIKLVEEFLVPDFGFAEKEIEINFSGNRGYHLHIGVDRVLQLDGFARRELSEYIAGSGIDFEDFFPTVAIKGTRLRKLMGPKPTDGGWKGKIANNFLRSLNTGVGALMELGMAKAQAAQLFQKRALVEMGIRGGNWDMVYIKNKDEFWRGVISKQAIIQSDKIDKNVTSDPTHLLRMPNTIHGDTGLIAKKVGTKSSLANFDPMIDAIAFTKGESKIYVSSSPELKINDKTYGPYSNQEVIVPIYVAAYLHLKGVGVIKGYRQLAQSK